MSAVYERWYTTNQQGLTIAWNGATQLCYTDYDCMPIADCGGGTWYCHPDPATAVQNMVPYPDVTGSCNNGVGGGVGPIAVTLTP